MPVGVVLELDAVVVADVGRDVVVEEGAVVDDVRSAAAVGEALVFVAEVEVERGLLVRRERRGEVVDVEAEALVGQRAALSAAERQRVDLRSVRDPDERPGRSARPTRSRARTSRAGASAAPRGRCRTRPSPRWMIGCGTSSHHLRYFFSHVACSASSSCARPVLVQDVGVPEDERPRPARRRGAHAASAATVARGAASPRRGEALA